MNIRAWLHCLIALSLPLVAYGEDLNYVYHIKTRYGLVVLKANPDEYPLPNTDLIINGKKITKTADVIVNKIAIGSQDILLLQDTSGGTSCPALFTLVIIEKKVLSVSESFGNCSDQPVVSMIKDTLLIKFPRVNRFASAETEQFENGKLYGLVFSGVKGEEGKKVRGEIKIEKFSF